MSDRPRRRHQRRLPTRRPTSGLRRGGDESVDFIPVERPVPGSVGRTGHTRHWQHCGCGAGRQHQRCAVARQRRSAVVDLERSGRCAGAGVTWWKQQQQQQWSCMRSDVAQVRKVRQRNGVEEAGGVREDVGSSQRAAGRQQLPLRARVGRDGQVDGQHVRDQREGVHSAARQRREADLRDVRQPQAVRDAVARLEVRRVLARAGRRRTAAVAARRRACARHVHCEQNGAHRWRCHPVGNTKNVIFFSPYIFFSFFP